MGDEGPTDETERSEPDSGSGGESIDISETTAPSIGPNTKIERDSPEERLARHEQSDKDAMGLDKRREVVGGRYSASATRQIVTYAIAVVVAIGIFIGLKALISDLDKAPAHPTAQAPWSGNHIKPKPLQ